MSTPTTIPGIVAALQALTPNSRQCPSVCTSRGKRDVSVVFCRKREGHDGDHRGTGRQWNAAGERVAITEKSP